MKKFLFVLLGAFLLMFSACKDSSKSENKTQEEKIRTIELSDLLYSETAKKREINNQPNDEQTIQLNILIDSLLNPLQGKINKQMVVVSGFRCDQLNKAVGGVKTSQHKRGQAADIKIKGISYNDVVKTLESSGLRFDQAIIEHVGDAKWLHLSYNSGKNRKEILFYDGKAYEDITYNYRELPYVSDPEIEITINKNSKASKANMAKIKTLENEIFICVAHVEGFRYKPYFCGAKQTIGYGTTVYPNGKRVKKTDKAITKTFGKKCVLEHLRKHVYPFISQYVTRELSKEELLGTCLFIYNIGGENFSGYDKDGKKIGNPSGFIKAINSGMDSYNAACRMSGFRSMTIKKDGKDVKVPAAGLIKRHWVGMALFCGKLTPKQITKLAPEGFYGKDDFLFYYKGKKIDKSGYYHPDFSDKKMKQFIKENTGKTTVLSIVDNNTQKKFK